MNVRNVINDTINYFRQTWNHLSPVQQTISTIALTIFSTLSLIYIAYSAYNKLFPPRTPDSDVVTRYNAYSKFLTDHPEVGPWGKLENGEIALIANIPGDKETQEVIGGIEEKHKRKIGIVYQDKFWTQLNDPVIFPGGKQGIYARIIQNSSLEGITGSVVLPVLEDGKIALIVNYRHATRSWECELPRGGSKKGESARDCAIREAKEETGVVLDTCEELGVMPPDSGLTASLVHVFIGKVTKIEAADPEHSEAIAKVVKLSMKEIDEAFKTQKITIEKGTKKIEAHFRDPFLTYALYKRQVLGL